ncbi:MAG: M48 family peptidase [Calditrichaeota bacterium]|nr:MAG: M48 family peptidase [Calditrichota bacterium]
MKRYSIILLLTTVFTILTCSTVPITGRKQLSLIPSGQLLSMSFQQYNQFLQENKLSDNQQQAEMVKRVGQNIQKAVEQFFAEQGMSEQLNNYQWEFHLIESEEVNAWCMPGGKVVVYEGILPVTQNETGLAVVMGHEIAHAIAQHGNERMSQGLLAQVGQVALDVALSEQPEQTRALWMTAYGVGAQVGVLLPFSRTQESEADRLGLIFMAMAGYDPHAAVDFWQRMSAKSGGASVPEFLSTHPSDQTRIENLQKLVPEAMKYYNK